MKTLNDLLEGESATIKEIEGCKGIKSRLCSLGILNGHTVDVIKNDGHGPIIIKVFDSKIAIGRGQASKINIEV